MTYEEIKLAVECCTDEEVNWCVECPMYEHDRDNDFCQEDLLRSAFDLINRQQAEIRKYKNCYEQVKWERDLFEEQCKTAKAEAIKEFADRLKKLYETYPDDEEASALYLINKINEIVKEMKR